MTHTTRLLSIVIPSFALVTGVSAQQTTASAPAQHHATTGKQVMGFDQDKTTHHFYLYEDGGAIDVSVKDQSDKANIDAIRAHLPHIATMFGQGHFDAPMMVHDTTAVPGIAELSKFKDKVKWAYTETPTGGRVDVVTADKDALAAVHAFLKFQISEHATGDKTSVAKRKG
jgi:hypothetical protein